MIVAHIRTLSEAKRLLESVQRANYREGVEEAGFGDGPDLDRLREESREAAAKMRALLEEVMGSNS